MTSTTHARRGPCAGQAAEEARTSTTAAARASRGLVGGGIGTVIIVLVSICFGIDPRIFLETAPQEPAKQEAREARGFTVAAVGPFYCPADRKVYI